MATIGCSKPMYAIYNTDTHAYSDGGVIAKARSFSIEPDSNNDNKYYADNQVTENENNFGSGTMSLNVDDLEPDVAAAIFGVKKESITSPITGTMLSYGDDQAVPHLGFGIVKKRMKNGTVSFVGIVLTNIQFTSPTEEADTQEDEIDWKDTPLEATIMRDGTDRNDWKKICYCSTESDAVTWIKSVLSITA